MNQIVVLQNLYRQFPQKNRPLRSFSGVEKALQKQMGLTRAVFVLRREKSLKRTDGKRPFSPSVEKAVFAHLKNAKTWILGKKKGSQWLGFWPVVIDADWVGCFALGSRLRPGFLSEEEKGLMELLAGRTALYFEMQRLVKDLEREDTNSSLILQTNAMLHEMRGSLTALSTLVQLWPEKKNDDRFIGSFQSFMLSQINRLTRMTKTFFETIHRGSNGKKRIDFSRVVNQAAGLLGPSFMAKRVQLKVKNSHGLFLKGDEPQLESLILNLTQNALDSTGSGGMVELSTASLSRPAYGPGRWIELKVKDKGIGISKGHLEKVFDPYFSTRGRGRGLGLSICQRVVENHQGKIKIRSSKRNTVFQVFLPGATKP